jgi:uncharacterized membrane protein HdeD (DUF308 family)
VTPTRPGDRDPRTGPRSLVLFGGLVLAALGVVLGLFSWPAGLLGGVIGLLAGLLTIRTERRGVAIAAFVLGALALLIGITGLAFFLRLRSR